MQNFVGKTKCIVGYMKVADSLLVATNTIVFCFFRRAPEVSLNPEETRREEIFFSDSVSQYHSDPGAEEPLLSNKTNLPNYTV